MLFSSDKINDEVMLMLTDMYNGVEMQCDETLDQFTDAIKNAYPDNMEIHELADVFSTMTSRMFYEFYNEVEFALEDFKEDLETLL